jgi:hypothetical protein
LVAAARTTGCYRKSVPWSVTTKHTGCSRTHTQEHRGLWRGIWEANWALCSGGSPGRRVGAAAAAAQHEEGRVGLAARLRRPKNADSLIFPNRQKHFCRWFAFMPRSRRRSGGTMHPAMSWSSVDVDTYVKGLHTSLPLSLDVDGSTFLGLTDEALVILGVTSAVDRQLLLASISELNSQLVLSSKQPMQPKSACPSKTAPGPSSSIAAPSAQDAPLQAGPYHGPSYHGIGHIYFEQQNLFLCGVHCLNNLLQSARFGPGDLAEMAMLINRQERELGITSTPDANSCGAMGFFSVQVLAHALAREGFAMHCANTIRTPLQVRWKRKSNGNARAFIGSYPPPLPLPLTNSPISPLPPHLTSPTSPTSLSHLSHPTSSTSPLPHHLSHLTSPTCRRSALSSSSTCTGSP